VAALVLSFLCAAGSANGSSRSLAGITLNSKLIMFSLLALPAGAGIIAGLLKWRRIEPLALTWGYGVVAGLSWLGLLFMAQVKDVIPHLHPFLTVPLLVGAAFATGTALTDESTTATGRYACLAGVLAAHIGIVAIVVTIVLA
jgi:hypothetical protein